MSEETKVESVKQVQEPAVVEEAKPAEKKRASKKDATFKTVESQPYSFQVLVAGEYVDGARDPNNGIVTFEVPSHLVDRFKAHDLIISGKVVEA